MSSEAGAEAIEVHLAWEVEASGTNMAASIKGGGSFKGLKLLL